ncbi:MAG: hypothetical protein IKD11_05235 [Oscillospiraceae bacterium]|nr:hypothetical protein [Oscillospiraceae bacterium]
MKNFVRRHLRRILFVSGGAVAGLLYYFFVGCAGGSCAIGANPVSSVLYMAFLGWLLSGGCCAGGSCRV